MEGGCDGDLFGDPRGVAEEADAVDVFEGGAEGGLGEEAGGLDGGDAGAGAA